MREFLYQKETMPQKTYYIDSNIWLNLFKKEGDPTKGVPYWKIAKDFLEQVIFSEHQIAYSGFVLKELKYNLKDRRLFEEKKKFLEDESKFVFVKAKVEDYDYARKLESEHNFILSFFDCIHIAICQRLGFFLVTRDKLLMKIAKKVY